MTTLYGDTDPNDYDGEETEVPAFTEYVEDIRPEPVPNAAFNYDHETNGGCY